MADNKKQSKSNVGTDTTLPKALPNKAKSATPASSTSKGQAIRKTNRNTRVVSIADVRQESTDIKAIRLLSQIDGVTATSMFTAASIANTKLKVTAYDTNTATFNGQGTQLLKAIMASMNTLSDYTLKYTDKMTLRQFIEAALLDLQVTSGVGCELVLNKERMPSHLQLVSYEQIEFVSDGNGGRKPVQKVQGSDDVDLDIPNFWISETNRDITKAYATPLLLPALNVSVTNNEFIEDMRRSVSVTGHSRLVVTLKAKEVAATASEDVRDDPVKLMEYLLAYQTAMSNSLAQLSPEDSIVVYDNVEVDVKDIGGNKSDYVPLMKTLNNLQATALKTPSSIIGLRSEGSQSLSNIEALTYIKMLSALRGPIADVLSRALTLAIRLYGLDVYATVEFEAIELRPENELEAYLTMRHQRYLENLSLGLWTQEQYCHEAGIPYRPDMPDLSGTMFHQKGGQKGTETPDNSGGAERTLNSNTPKKAGGKSQ